MNNNKVTVFFGCSIRGGHRVVSPEVLANIPDIIEELGHKLSSRHQTAPGVIASENKLAPRQIHDRDYEWLIGADVGIFEVSNPSLGVGAEISDMLHLGKPILCLFQGEESNVSAYIRGKEESRFVEACLESHQYNNYDEAREIIKMFLKKFF